MLPYFNKPEFPKVKNLIKGKVKLFLHQVKVFYINYYFPDKLGNLIDIFLSDLLKDKFVFIRANGDHFGNWMFIILYCLSSNDKLKIKPICLAKRGTVNSYWLNFFIKKKIIIIYNPFLRALFASFFFSKKLAIDVNGNIPLSFYMANIKYENYKSMSPINKDFLKKYSINPKTNKKNIIFKKSLILFYARSGDWEYSIKNSMRNMSEYNKRKILKILSIQYNVFLIADSKLNKNQKIKGVFDESDLDNLDLSLNDIYRNAKCIIGSISGASHFPSIVYNLPTLYIGFSMPVTIGSLYMFPKEIPKKDHYFFINDYDLRNLNDKELSEIIIKFASTLNIKFTPNTKSFSYKLFNSGRYQLIENDYGQIHFYKDFDIRTNK